MREHEDVLYMRMMEALDGELAEAELAELEADLRVRPDLAFEWHAMQAIDQLFRSTPALRPAADFAQRTVARLPNRRARLWFSLALYLLFMASGLVPLAVLAWFAWTVAPALFEPALLRGIVQAVGAFVDIAGLAFTSLLSGAAQFAQQQPAVLGGLLVMVGVISLWVGVYKQLVTSPVNSNA